MAEDFKFEIGAEVKDLVTGFTGVVMARVQYLTGCNQYHVAPRKLNKNGERIGGDYYDENRIVLTGGSRFVLQAGRPTKQHGSRGGPSGMEPRQK